MFGQVTKLAPVNWSSTLQLFDIAQSHLCVQPKIKKHFMYSCIFEVFGGMQILVKCCICTKEREINYTPLLGQFKEELALKFCFEFRVQCFVAAKSRRQQEQFLFQVFLNLYCFFLCCCSPSVTISFQLVMTIFFTFLSFTSSVYLSESGRPLL